MNLKDITIGTKLSRLEQRVIDILIEKYIFDREVFTTKLRGLRPKPRGLVSFPEPNHFDKYGSHYTAYEARITPYFTRAIEPVDHYLIPRMNELDYTVVVTHNSKFKTVGIHKGSSPQPCTTIVHESRTIAIAVACLDAIAPNLDHRYFNKIAEEIKK